MRRSRTAILVPALIGMLALTACNPLSSDEEQEGRPLPVGTVLDGIGDVEGDGLFVTIPTGRIDFIVGTPTDDLPSYDETYDHAADGASIVGVSWNWDFLSAFRSMADERTNAVEPHVSLVADGRQYSLDEAMLASLDEDSIDSGDVALDFRGTAWVGVAGEPRDLAIRVEFDGLEQVVEVDDPRSVRESPAGSLYQFPDDLAMRISECAPPRAGGRAIREGNGQCQVETARVPYHPAIGWVASAEDSWLVVRTIVRPDVHWAAPARCGSGELGEVTYRLEGAKPAAVEQVDPDNDPSGRDLVIFASGRATGPNELVMRAEMTFPDGDCAPLSLTWRHRVY